ncbi:MULTISPECIES: Fe-S cluster assembly protein SufD [Alphaproteobacteria]|uniref:Fe-S cluster assembly protein SufD n=2 Tax=Alphaproteobacteria TaxID=28211 RepID=A0A512HHP6_9HYPH|nr:MULTISPECIES: Fe-S cluster assembly protein SufD [Alphaproteobacteria]GEO84975.1 Fe-S cluster assembly protein SufD [Ciceribacter naphthalenivorans]GLR22909.1 Fe-S cluster assembly protein SufD [Ciceribacter naphthalenivorans]GLT05765.1 Fe-S cluster assembly protein SufD [Sphingomonas psychrolutea]
MTIQAANRLTVAESQLIEAYTSQIGGLPGNGEVLAARDLLFDDLKRGGLPTRRIESWHYTDLKALLRAVPAFDPSASAKAEAPIVAGATVLSLLHGSAELAAMPDGVEASGYREQLTSGSAAAGLKARDADDAIGRLNGSFVQDGIVLAVAADTDLQAPIELQSIHGAGAVHMRYPAVFGVKSRTTVIERHLANGAGVALVSSIADLKIEDGAEVTWIILQTEGLEDTHFGQIKVELGTDAKFRLFIVNAGGKLVRQEIHLRTVGEGSDFQLRAVNLLGGESHTDVTMTLGHDVPNTTSTEIIRNVVFDRAKGVFQGMIRVAPDAQKTDARMACNTLLMSDDAEFSVKPELEIFADDVQCAHGATVADILKTHLYYLMSRGIPEKTARALLINGFVAEIVEELEDEALVTALEGIISNWLERHG